MKGDAQIGTAICSAGSNYAMDSDFNLIVESDEVFAVVFQLINRLVHVSQGGVALLLFKRFINFGPPAFGQLLECADVKIAVVKKCFQSRHVLHQKTPILADTVATHGRALLRHILAQKVEQLRLSISLKQ